MDNITLFAPAKINLCLDVTRRRADGYHDIESIMQSVSLCDRVEVQKKDRGTADGMRRIVFRCDHADIPCDEKNLAHRAAVAFFEYCSIENYDVEIKIEKNIPVAAGLAGGSTDAAATIIALSALYKTELSLDALCRIGASIGADVPFCIRRGTCRATGIGDELCDVAHMPDCAIVIARDGLGVSTPWAYGELDRAGVLKHPSAVELERALVKNDLSGVLLQIGNVFEDVVLPYHPKADALKKKILDFGALGALMSGSGPSVFGIFADAKKAKSAVTRLRRRGIEAHLCRPYYPPMLDYAQNR